MKYVKDLFFLLLGSVIKFEIIAIVLEPILGPINKPLRKFMRRHIDMNPLRYQAFKHYFDGHMGMSHKCEKGLCQI